MTSYVLCKTGSLAVFKVTARDQGHYKGPSGAFVTYCNISCFFLFFFATLNATYYVAQVDRSDVKPIIPPPLAPVLIEIHTTDGSTTNMNF